MSNSNFIMTTFTKQLSKMFGVLTIAIVMLSSCVQEADIEITDPDVKSAFDKEISAVFEIMEDDPNLAIEKLDKISTEAETINSKFYAGVSKWYKGYIYDDVLEDVSLAYHNYKEALKDILQTDNSALALTIYNNLGILYRFYGQYDAAITNYESAVSLKGDLPIDELSNVYYNYGVALKLKGDSTSFFAAEQAFTKSLELAQQIDYHENIASVYNQIGLMYKTIEDYEMARLAYNNTIRTYISNPDLHDKVGKAYHGIGVTYMDEGNAEASVRAFEKALEYKKSSGSIFITKYDLGTVLFKDGKTEEAISIWKDALNEKHDKNNIEQVQIYSDLTVALKLSNKYEEALDYSEVYNASIREILERGEKQKIESDQVLFANVVNEYDEFNQPVPFFSRPLVILFSIITLMVLAYAITILFYRSRSKRKISEVVSEIQSEFLNIKVD